MVNTVLKQPLLHFTKFTIATATLLAAVSLSGCNQPTVLEEVKQTGTLKILTRNTPTTYYEGSDGPAGLEYELASMFADHLGVKLEIDSNHDIQDIYQSLENGDAHLAAAGLEISLERTSQVYFSQSYMDVQPVVIYNRKKKTPRTIEDLIGKQTAVIAGTNNAQLLRELQQKHPKLSWKETSDLEATDLIRMVHEQELDAAVINSNEFDINKAYYSRAKQAFTLDEPHKLAWAMPKHRDNTLYNAVRDFFNQIEANGTLSQIKDRYFGHTEELNYVGVQLFLRHIRNRMPKYEKHFKQAAEKYNLDWRLLAATGYQESHWRPRAKSPTGVRGIMMLTLNTASDMGVSNRLDPKQSIYGGARYLSKLIRRMPEQILEPDRTWMALASYNVGYGHLEDARKITEHMKKDPNKWIDVREHLPLLQKRNWYRFTKHGFARGEEPVHYVQNIRQYYDILTWYDSRLQQVAQNQATEKTVDEAVSFSIVPPVL